MKFLFLISLFVIPALVLSASMKALRRHAHAKKWLAPKKKLKRNLVLDQLDLQGYGPYFSPKFVVGKDLVQFSQRYALLGQEHFAVRTVANHREDIEKMCKMNEELMKAKSPGKIAPDKELETGTPSRAYLEAPVSVIVTCESSCDMKKQNQATDKQKQAKDKKAQKQPGTLENYMILEYVEEARIGNYLDHIVHGGETSLLLNPAQAIAVVWNLICDLTTLEKSNFSYIKDRLVPDAIYIRVQPVPEEGEAQTHVGKVKLYHDTAQLQKTTKELKVQSVENTINIAQLLMDLKCDNAEQSKQYKGTEHLEAFDAFQEFCRLTKGLKSAAEMYSKLSSTKVFREGEKMRLPTKIEKATPRKTIEELENDGIGIPSTGLGLGSASIFKHIAEIGKSGQSAIARRGLQRNTMSKEKRRTVMPDYEDVALPYASGSDYDDDEILYEDPGAVGGGPTYDLAGAVEDDEPAVYSEPKRGGRPKKPSTGDSEVPLSDKPIPDTPAVPPKMGGATVEPAAFDDIPYEDVDFDPNFEDEAHLYANQLPVEEANLQPNALYDGAPQKPPLSRKPRKL